MKKSKIVHCNLDECYFQNTYLVGVDFSGSTFINTLFHNTDMQKANFTDASGYVIDPRVNKIKKAIFSVPDVLNLLNCFDIEIK